MNSEDISHEVDVRIEYILIKHRVKKYRKTCQCPKPILTANRAPRLFPKSLFSTDFWIKTLTDKYGHGIPLTRQMELMAQEGLKVAKSTLTEGVYRCAEYLKPLYERICDEIIHEELVNADETRWKNWQSAYQPPGSEPSKPLHWLWGFFSNNFRLFVIDPTRSAEVLRRLFGQGESRTLLPLFVTDRFKAYSAACTLLAFCWAHVRRDFLNLQIKFPQDLELSQWAQSWLDLISKLYHINSKRTHTQKKEFQLYQKQLQEVLSDMLSLIYQVDEHPEKLRQSESMLNHWEGLTLFLDYPQVPLDNNLAERELRKPVVGRKNFYGTHSDQATESTAIFYSILSTCRLHNINPKKFLNRYFTFCANQKSIPNKNQVKAYLPHRYKKIYPEDLLLLLS